MAADTQLRYSHRNRPHRDGEYSLAHLQSKARNITFENTPKLIRTQAEHF